MVPGWDGLRGEVVAESTDFCAWERGEGLLGTGEMMGHEGGELVAGHETACVHR